MKHMDLFSGYGGFSLALQNIYGKLHLRHLQQDVKIGDGVVKGAGGESSLLASCDTIGFSEIDKYASAVLKYHWPKIKNYGDITKIDWAEVPDFDLLTGGSPCQDLSIAGKRAGLEGARSGLFYEYMRAVKEKRPKYFIWENVKGALSSNKGFDFGAVINEMAETGYSLWWQVLNAKDFGVPQNRERIFVIGFRDGYPGEVFFERRKNEEVSSKVHPCDAHYYKGHSNQRQMMEVCQPVLTPDRAEKRQNGRRFKEDGEPSFTLTSQDKHGVYLPPRIRRLTPTECERLMGLPDDWTKWGYIKLNNEDDGELISDSQRYKLCGNGVVVNVAEAVIKNIIL